MGGQSVSRIAQWDGMQWQPLGAGLSSNYSYYSMNDMAEYQGDLYVAGDFDTADGQPSRAIARWDGAQWHALPTGFNSVSGAEVYSLTLFDGELIAGSNAGLFRWDGVQFQPFVHRPAGAPLDLATWNNFLVVTGIFSSVGSLGTGPVAFYGPSSDFTDFTCDGAWNLSDHATLLDCLTGPDSPYPPGCLMTDTNASRTVDLADFAALQNSLGGL